MLRWARPHRWIKFNVWFLLYHFAKKSIDWYTWCLFAIFLSYAFFCQIPTPVCIEHLLTEKKQLYESKKRTRFEIVLCRIHTFAQNKCLRFRFAVMQFYMLFHSMAPLFNEAREREKKQLRFRRTTNKTALSLFLL